MHRKAICPVCREALVDDDEDEEKGDGEAGDVEDGVPVGGVDEEEEAS